MKPWIANLSEQEAKAQLQRADNLLLKLIPLGLVSERVDVMLMLASTYRKYVNVAVEAESRG